MVSVHGFVEAAQHAVGVGTDSSAVKMILKPRFRRVGGLYMLLIRIC